MKNEVFVTGHGGLPRISITFEIKNQAQDEDEDKFLQAIKLNTLAHTKLLK